MTLGDERRWAEDPLVYARPLRDLFESLPALMAYWDGDQHNVFANASHLQWYGLTPDQIRGRHLREVMGAELYDTDQPFIAAVLRGEQQQVERVLVDAAGNVRHTQTTYLPDIFDHESQGFFVVDADITPWVEATRLLDEAQRLAQIGSWVHDLKSDTVTWTDELFGIYGEDPQSFIPTIEAMTSRVHPDDLDRFRSARERARVNGDGYDSSHRIVLADGRVREVREREKPQEGRGGIIVRVLGTVQDMTEINAAAREVARVNSELRRANEVNADVMAMLGHDVRSPLTVMLGRLEGLVADWDSTSEDSRLEHARRIQRAAQRMEILVDDILTMAAADAGELTLHPADVKVEMAVGEALDAVSAEGAVQVEVDAGLTVRADPFHVRQIVANLITNALRYGEPPVMVSATEDGVGTVTVRVRDHGHGVATDAIPVLFDRFSKSGTPKAGVTVGPATGFGLYIAARMASLNHGRLTYEPAEPGACFALTLPGVSR